jgi:NAD(P)-dependent dehydrogenase (short-subunit alcohol dehydrogenase family)
MKRIVKNADPREAGPKPPFPQPEIAPPGKTGEMKPRPDHGEESYEGNGLLDGHVALVTGGDSGIGRAVAIAFAREGADILISYLSEEKDAKETAEWVERAGQKALCVRGDLQKEEFCEELIRTCLSQFGRLDILVNNAAFQSTHSDVTELPTEDFDRAFKTNVYGAFFLSRAALCEMKPGASIINTTSIQGFDPGGHLLHYAATKGAIANMTKTFAEMAIERGVRVNAVAPGPVWTPLIPSTMPPEKVRDFGNNTLFKRPAQPAELAPVFVFLASTLASYVSGEIYGVTGGRMPL